MKRIKEWFLNRFLPMWAKETVFKENKTLRKENERLHNELARKNAYIDGILMGIKNQRRFVINTTEGKK